MLPRERLVEIVVAVAGVGAMVLALYLIGRRYGSVEDGHRVLDATGGELIVFSIAAFVLLMAAAGLFLLRTVTVPEAESDDGNGDATNG